MNERSRKFRWIFWKVQESGHAPSGQGSPKPDSIRSLDVYRDCEKPPLGCKELGFLTDGGRIFEQSEIEAAFVKRAKEMGADALVLRPPVKSVESPPGWNLFDTFLYEAVVVSYA